MTEIETSTKISKKGLLLVIFLGVVLAAALLLVKQSQELQKGASFASATMSVLPAQMEGQVGTSLPLKVGVSLPDGVKIDGADVEVTYDSCLLELTEETVVINEEAFKFLQYIEFGGPSSTCQQKVSVMAGSNLPAAQLKAGYVIIATLNFRPKKVGEGTVTVIQSTALLTGDNPGSQDKQIAVSAAQSSKVTIKAADVEPSPTGPLPTEPVG